MDSALFQSLQLHSICPSPILIAELSPALGDLVKTKSHCRGESGLAQPTGTSQSHKCEDLLYSAPLFLESYDKLTLPVLIALKLYRSVLIIFLCGKFQGFKMKGLNLDFLQNILFLSEILFVFVDQTFEIPLTIMIVSYVGIFKAQLKHCFTYPFQSEHVVLKLFPVSLMRLNAKHRMVMLFLVTNYRIFFFSNVCRRPEIGLGRLACKCICFSAYTHSLRLKLTSK